MKQERIVSMATLLSLFFSLLLLSISANGRSTLQKINYTDVNTDLSRSFSLATNTYTGKTNYNDVVGLVNICTQFISLVEQNEDPCLPPKWTWIRCNSDPKPRVIALNLNNKLLFGQLPDFSTMDALQRIDLSVNSLFGTIPSFLGTFPDLQELNIASNFFYGLVPDSLACNNKLKLTATGNSGLYTSDTCTTSNKDTSPTSNKNVGVPTTVTEKKSSKVGVIVGSSISVFLLFWIAIGVFIIYRHRAKTAAAIAQPSAQQEPKDISTEEMPMNARTNITSP